MTVAVSSRGGAGLKLGLAITAIFAAAAALSIFWTPRDVAELNAAAQFAPPSAAYPLGANHLGRDVLSMLMVGARLSIGIAFAAVLIGVIFGVPIGLAASVSSGWFDDVAMRASDVVFAFPALLSAILLAAIFGPGAWVAALAIGIFNIPVFARMTRGAARPIWRREFVLSARAAGLTTPQIAIRHILPNIRHVLIVQATLQLSLAILAEAGLSYVGLGVQPPTPSWGAMLADSQTMLVLAPWLSLYPGLAIFLFVFGLNLIGSGLRRRLDVHHSRAAR